jgi:GrpB-like predicted nucleotidyltransferase (UPF0157 family)
MLGLKRHTVKLEEHNEVWEQAFNEAKQELILLIENNIVGIEHIGSTAIKGIAAKPILDIAIAINDNGLILEINSILTKNNYIYRGDSGDSGGHLFIKESKPDIRTHHIHIIHRNDLQWDNYLLFKNKLNNDQNLSQEYSLLKRKLEIEFAGDRVGYTDSKNDFIKSVLNS